MSNNRFVEKSEKIINGSGNTSMAYALLALAYEQRTANMLTYLALAGNSETASIPVPVTRLMQVQRIVEDRLDLE